MKVFSSNLFQYDAKRNVLKADFKDLTGKNYGDTGQSMFDAVWTNESDGTFIYITSERTGTTEKFKLSGLEGGEHSHRAINPMLNEFKVIITTNKI